MSVKRGILIGIIVLFSIPLFGANKEVAILQSSQGFVDIVRNSSSITAIQGMRLYENDKLSTVGADTWAQLYFLNGSSLILSPRTAIVIGEGNSSKHLNLAINSGEVWTEIRPNVATTVKSPLGRVSGLSQKSNTSFRLALIGQQAELQVQKGELSLSPLSGSPTLVKSGKIAVAKGNSISIEAAKSYQAPKVENIPVQNVSPNIKNKRVRHQICNKETNECFSVDVLFKRK